MWVRNQESNQIISLNQDTISISIEKDGTYWTCLLVLENNKIELGRYLTKEKALMVLDLIADNIKNHMQYMAMPQDDIKGDNNEE